MKMKYKFSEIIYHVLYFAEINDSTPLVCKHKFQHRNRKCQERQRQLRLQHRQQHQNQIRRKLVH